MSTTNNIIITASVVAIKAALQIPLNDGRRTNINIYSLVKI